MDKIILVIARLVLATVFVAGFIILIQDFLIFPGLYSSYLWDRQSTAPAEVEEFKLAAADNQNITVWKHTTSTNENARVALIFHGNGEHLDNFFHMQQWLATLGITSYSMEYRGYNGRSSGWPSEKHFYLDGETTLEFILKNESIAAQELLILGSSMGTGLAAYLAAKYQVGDLVLLSPYTSIPNLVGEMPLYGYLKRFLKYEFPVYKYVEQLQNTRLILVHGQNDTVIPHSHSVALEKYYRGNKALELISHKEAGHNDLLGYTRERLEDLLTNSANPTLAKTDSL